MIRTILETVESFPDDVDLCTELSRVLDEARRNLVQCLEKPEVRAGVEALAQSSPGLRHAFVALQAALADERNYTDYRTFERTVWEAYTALLREVIAPTD